MFWQYKTLINRAVCVTWLGFCLLMWLYVGQWRFYGTIYQNIDQARLDFNQFIEAGACSKALSTVMSLVAFGNKWFSDNTPWKTLDPQVIAECTTIIRAATNMLKYFIPNGTAKVQTWLANDTLDDNISVLYKKLDIKEIQERTW